MQDKELLLHRELGKSYRQTFIVYSLFTFVLFAALMLLVLYYVRVNDSRLIVNCASFTSHAEANTYVALHPEYRKRLDRDGKDGACTTYPYR